MSNIRASVTLLLGFAALGPIVAPVQAGAQPFSQAIGGLEGVFGPVVPGPGDAQMLEQRTQSLLGGPAQPRILDWSNPRSGNHGTVTLQWEFVRQAQQCRQIEYRIVNSTQDLPQVASLAWCKQGSGRWAIVG
jgi:surface antigen